MFQKHKATDDFLNSRLTKVYAVVFLLTFCIMLLTTFAAAQNRSGEYRRIDGDWNGSLDIKDVGKGKKRRLIILNTIGRTNPGCSGAIDGEAKFISKNAAVMMKKTGDYDNESKTESICRIRYTFSKNKVVVDEGDNCSWFHGASCEFSGTYYRNLRKTKLKKGKRIQRR